MITLPRCSRCVLPVTHETLALDPTTGVCNICQHHDRKVVVDWVARRHELDAIADRYRGRRRYDCIVPFSGGKDSSYIAYFVTRELGLRPLVVRFDHGFLRPNVIANTVRSLGRLGCDLHQFTPSWPVVRRTMLQSFLEKGDFCWHCHTGIYAYPMQVALQQRIPLVIWGEHSSEYTAYYGVDDDEQVDERRFNRFVNLGISADDMRVRLRGMVTKQDLAFAQYPALAALRRLGYRSICLGSYIPWDTKRQVEIIKRELGWRGDEVEGVPPQYDYEKVECQMQGVRDYIKFIKRGYARVSHLTSIDIRNGRMSREQALGLVDAWEGKRPRILDRFLWYIGLTEDEFRHVALSHTISPYHHDFTGGQHGAPVRDMAQWPRNEPMPRAEATTLLAHWQRGVGGE